MSDLITVAVLAGTTRKQRESIKAAQYVAEFGRQLPNVEIIFVDPADFHFPNDGDAPEDKDPRYTEITARADAFFIVTPEYNHSIPSSLKRMLDSEHDNYFHKPVIAAGASSGPWGGTRVCEALLHVFHTLGMVTIKPEVYFPKVQDIFSEAGDMKPEYTERYQKSVGAAYDELLWMARLFKLARAELADVPAAT